MELEFAVHVRQFVIKGERIDVAAQSSPSKTGKPTAAPGFQSSDVFLASFPGAGCRALDAR